MLINYSLIARSFVFLEAFCSMHGKVHGSAGHQIYVSALHVSWARKTAVFTGSLSGFTVFLQDKHGHVCDGGVAVAVSARRTYVHTSALKSIPLEEGY